MSKKPKSRLVRWLLPAFIVTVGLLFWLLKASARPQPTAVTIASPQYRVVAEQVRTNGVVVPITEFQARANFPGMIDRVYVALGDAVEPGQMLIQMKDPFASSRVATANSALQAARLEDQEVHAGGSQDERIAITGDLEHAQLAQADAARGLASLQQLQQKGAASAAEVSVAMQHLQATNVTLQTLQQRDTHRYTPANLTSVAARLADAQASLNAAKIAFDNANIRSPMAGTVYSVSVTPYEFAPMGADLLRVADLNQLQIRAYFDEPEVGELVTGQKVDIVWDARPGHIWHGHIKQAPVAAMPMGVRSVAECLIKIDDAHRDLLPNTNVMVTVTIQEHPNVLAIPREALHDQGPHHFVYRIVDGKLQSTPVDLGLVTLDWVEIKHGLNPTDVVALDAMNGHQLIDHLAVRDVRPDETYADTGSHPIARFFYRMLGSNIRSQTP